MQLIAVHGRPLVLINDEPFQNILHLTASSNVRCKEINAKAVKAMMPDVAHDIKIKIRRRNSREIRLKEKLSLKKPKKTKRRVWNADFSESTYNILKKAKLS